MTLTESFNLSRKKAPRRERRSDVILPPLNDPPSSKSAENFLTGETPRRRRLSGLTSENLPRQREPRRRNSTFSYFNQSNALVPSLNQSKSSSNNLQARNLQDASTPSSGEMLKKAGRRRSSMPVVLVNGRKDFQRKDKKRISVGAQKSDEGFVFF